MHAEATPSPAGSDAADPVADHSAEDPAFLLKRVFVVDDSEIDSELLRLRLHGHYPGLAEVRWTSVTTGLIEQVAAFQPDLVITDYHMPGYDLIATLTQLRRRWPLLPVLVMSGLVGEEAAIQVLKAGANDFLPKSRSERLPLVINRELAEARAAEAEVRLRAELEMQRQINQAIFDQASAGLFVVSPTGVMDRINQHGVQMMDGARTLDIDGLATIEGWWVDSGQPIHAHDWPLARAFEHREHVPPRLMRVRTWAGSMRYFSCGAAPLQGADGSNLGAVASAMDVSTEVELQLRLRQTEARLRQLSINQNLQHERQMAVLSRELHDNLGQVLSLLKLHLGSAARTDMPLARRELEIDEALPLVDLALSRLREVCNDLLPSELSDFGLASALASLCGTAARASGVRVELTVEGEPRTLDPKLQLALFRVAQQALTNALCHAGAGTVLLALAWQPAAVQLCVTDDGSGFDAHSPRPASQQGLRGMRERMELLDGTLGIESSLGEGSRLCARLPTPADAQDAP